MNIKAILPRKGRAQTSKVLVFKKSWIHHVVILIQSMLGILVCSSGREVVVYANQHKYHAPKRRFEELRGQPTGTAYCRHGQDEIREVGQGQGATFKYTKSDLSRSGPDPDVFWINLDKSHERRKVFERELHSVGLLAGSSRIRALQPSMIVIPEELKIPHECKIWDIQNTADQHKLPELKKRPNGRVLIDGLCGRPRNNKKELTVTASHLNALRTAVNSGSDSPYALILEDDLEFAFDVDWHALAASAPQGFAMLQLVTSNEGNLQYLWKKYWQSEGKFMWEQRSDITDFWCAGAYIINKEVLKPVIDQIVRRVTDNGWIAMRIIAGYDCQPSYCCEKFNTDTGETNTIRGGYDFVNKTSYTARSNLLDSACIRAPRGYQADHYIFELARPHSYTLSIPLFRDSRLGVGNVSTVHQEQVRWHSPAFNAIAAIQDELNDHKNGKVKLPPFIRSCPLGHWSDAYQFPDAQEKGPAVNAGPGMADTVMTVETVKQREERPVGR